MAKVLPSPIRQLHIGFSYIRVGRFRPLDEAVCAAMALVFGVWRYPIGAHFEN